MDSMDWFDPEGTDAAAQARKFNHALKMDGRILLRSASIEPWYIKNFEENGFTARRVGARFPGSCIDRYVTQDQKTVSAVRNADILTMSRVNMYASTWICTKTRELERPRQDKRSNSVEYLEI
jgi:betaine lipid synthase